MKRLLLPQKEGVTCEDNLCAVYWLFVSLDRFRPLAVCYLMYVFIYQQTLRNLYLLTAYCSHMWQSLALLRSSGLSSIAVSLMCVALGNSTGTFKLGCFPFLQTSNPRGECSSQPQPAISLASRLRPAPRLSPRLSAIASAA